MKNTNLPRSPFSTPLSRAAKETELRLRNLFQWKKQRPPLPYLALMAAAVLMCGGLVSCQAEEPAAPDLSALLGQIDPGMIQMGMDVFRQVQSAEDRNAALLNALRPFLKEDRQARLDRALRIARTAKLVRVALGALGRKEGGERV